METQTISTVNTDTTIKPMVSVTPIAAEKVLELLKTKNLPGYGLRVFVQGGGCSGVQYGLGFENKTETDDFVFDSNGVRVYLDATSAMYLEGAIVDYISTPQGEGFRIENPNANANAGGCGCSSNSSGSCGSGGGGGGCSCGH